MTGGWAAWQRFWFAPVPARTVGLMRLSLGLLLLVEHSFLLSQLDTLFSASGPVPPEAAAGDLPWPRISLLDGIEDPFLPWLAGLLVYAAFAAGVGGRYVAVLALVVQVLLYHRDPFYQHGGDRVLRLVTLYLCLVPCTAGLSVDAWRARLRQGAQAVAARTVPMLAHRLIQIQLVAIYVHSGFVKASGRTWEDGTALYYALSNGQYARAPWLLEPLLDSGLFLAVSKVSTWLVLGWEFGFGALILWPRTRLLAIVIGLFMHGGIFFMLNVGSFSLVMIWAYQSLLDPQRVDGWLSRTVR